MFDLLKVGIFVYGILALVVKTFPTIPSKYPWLVTIISILGKITNRQTDDDAVRVETK